VPLCLVLVCILSKICTVLMNDDDDDGEDGNYYMGV